MWGAWCSHPSLASGNGEGGIPGVDACPACTATIVLRRSTATECIDGMCMVRDNGGWDGCHNDVVRVFQS